MKFEVYLPTKFKDRGGEEHVVSDKEVLDFCGELKKNFGGYTESNPVAAPPFRGWWIEQGIEYHDYPVSIFTLVEMDKEPKAIEFFEKWKAGLEKRFNQKVILICFHPIKVFGNL